MDSLIEIYRGHSPFNYTVNKLIKLIYPEGKSVAIDGEITSYAGLDAQYEFKGLQMRFGILIRQVL